MGFRKGRQYAITWVQKAANSRGTWNRYLTIGGKEYRPIDCYLEALKRDPEYAEAWCKLGSEITGMSEGEDTDKKLAGMDLFKDEPKITDKIGRLYIAHINAAIFCFDKAIEIKPKYGYASYKKGRLLERLSKYEEALECFENYSYEESKDVCNSNQLHKQALRDKLKQNEDGSTKSFEIYCDVLKNFFKDNELSEVELARKKLNENILQHIHKLDDNLDEDDFYERGEWLQDIGREKEALELYDEEIEKELEKGDLHMAAWANETKADAVSVRQTKDEFDCYEKTIQFCEKSRKDLTEDAAEYLSNAYTCNAFYFHRRDNMDKAIEYIGRAGELEREYGSESNFEWWRRKVSWLPDEEAIKFLDQEIKAWQNSSYYDGDDKKRYIEYMESSKNELLKKLAK